MPERFRGRKKEVYDHLEPYAMKPGSAFQKVNFLPDLQDEYQILGRSYFPGMDIFNDHIKYKIEEEIDADFRQAIYRD